MPRAVVSALEYDDTPCSGSTFCVFSINEAVGLLAHIL